MRQTWKTQSDNIDKILLVHGARHHRLSESIQALAVLLELIRESQTKIPSPRRYIIRRRFVDDNCLNTGDYCTSMGC